MNSLADGTKLNLFALAREFSVPGNNQTGNVTVKEFLLANNVDLDRFEKDFKPRHSGQERKCQVERAGVSVFQFQAVSGVTRRREGWVVLTGGAHSQNQLPKSL